MIIHIQLEMDMALVGHQWWQHILHSYYQNNRSRKIGHETEYVKTEHLKADRVLL